MNINCIICTELFVNPDNIFSTNCGHIFHHPCLLQWLARSKSCPQCRNKCSEKNIQRIYFNITSTDNIDDPATLMEKINDLELKVRSRDKDLKENKEMLEKSKSDLKNCAKTIKKLESMLNIKKEINQGLQNQIDILSIQQRKLHNIESENTNLIRKLNEMHAIESVLSGTQKEVEEMLKQQNDPKTLVVMTAALKRELAGNELKKQEMRKQLQKLQTELRNEHDKKKNLEEKLSELESLNHVLLNKIEHQKSNEDEIYTPELKKKRLLDNRGIQNTPSPMSDAELEKRVSKINHSDSPFLKIKSSSIGLAPLLRGTYVSSNGKQSSGAIRSVSNLLKPPNPDEKKDNPSVNNGSLSIFKKPRLAGTGLPRLKPSNSTYYNGLGGTSKMLLSDEKAEAKNKI